MEWADQGSEGGGYFGENEYPTPSGKSTKSTRQQFLCPVTIRQILEAPAEGMKVGDFDASMVTFIGIALNVDISSTKLQFTISDDTGVIDCIEWLESEGLKSKSVVDIMERSYYQVFGSVKTIQGKRKIMVFKVSPVEDFDAYFTHLAEVISVQQWVEDLKKAPAVTNENNFGTNNYSSNNYTNSSVSYDHNRTAFTPIQKAVLDAIKAVEGQIGWNKHESDLRTRFPVKQIDDALDFLVSEGHIYTTVDEDHYCST